MDGFIYECKKQKTKVQSEAQMLIDPAAIADFEYLLASGKSSTKSIKRLMYMDIHTVL